MAWHRDLLDERPWRWTHLHKTSSSRASLHAPRSVFSRRFNQCEARLPAASWQSRNTASARRQAIRNSCRDFAVKSPPAASRSRFAALFRMLRTVVLTVTRGQVRDRRTCRNAVVIGHLPFAIVLPFGASARQLNLRVAASPQSTDFCPPIELD